MAGGGERQVGAKRGGVLRLLHPRWEYMSRVGRCTGVGEQVEFPLNLRVRLWAMRAGGCVAVVTQ